MRLITALSVATICTFAAEPIIAYDLLLSSSTDKGLNVVAYPFDSADAASGETFIAPTQAKHVALSLQDCGGPLRFLVLDTTDQSLYRFVAHKNRGSTPPHYIIHAGDLSEGARVQG